MRGFLSYVCLIGVMACVACGSSDKPPGPLDHHFDDMYIAAIPLDQKANVVQTQQNWNVARMENANAEAQVKEADSQLHEARNDFSATKLAVDSAASNKKSADASADMNRINEATKSLATAKDVQKAAEARVKYLESYRSYLGRYLRYTQENMYFQEAAYESAKAQLAKTNNIAPKGVTYDSFPKQQDGRHSRTDSAKAKAENAKAAVTSQRDSWLQLQGQADKENGRAGVYWDPMAPKAAPAPSSAPAPSASN
ncbi:MAG: hypothetical protein ABJE66_38625 [Deltaproteobacteria bacterium]